MKQLAFDDIARDLLVFLKGQIPSLGIKETREEAIRQVSKIVITLRSSIIRLEGATFNIPQDSEMIQNLEEELCSLRKTNTKLEESLFLEMNKSQEVNNKLERYQNKLFEKQKNKTEALQKIAELENCIAVQDRTIKEYNDTEEVACDDLRTRIYDVEIKLSEANETSDQLRQTLQTKSIELSNCKEALMEAMKMGKPEIETLRIELSKISESRDENERLRNKILELEKRTGYAPIIDEYQNNVSALEARISYLEKELQEAQNQVKSQDNIEAFTIENKQLKQKISELEIVLLNTIKPCERIQKDSFTLKPEECVFLFETLHTTKNRLMNSPENKDLYVWAQGSIAILEKHKVVEKILTVGEIFDPRIHRATKAFKNDFLPDNIIVKEERPGFVSGTKIIQKAAVWIGKSIFHCIKCLNKCRSHEFFCPKCGLELTAPDGTSKRDLPPLSTCVQSNMLLIDKLIEQENLEVADKLIEYLSKDSPMNSDILERKLLLDKLRKTN